MMPLLWAEVRQDLPPAALLAEKGHDVLVVEKEKFPRYHVGESLMPFCYFPLDKLGLIDNLMESANPRKYCVQFVREDGFLSQPFYFFQHFDHPSSTTWQVWRSEFDQMIMDKARENGAQVMEETKAKTLLKSSENKVEGIKGGFQGSGRAGTAGTYCSGCIRSGLFSAHKEKWKVRDPELNKWLSGLTTKMPREIRDWMKV